MSIETPPPTLMPDALPPLTGLPISLSPEDPAGFPPPPPPNWQQVRRFSLFTTIAVALALVVFAVYYAVMVPVLVAAFLAYLMLPLVNRLVAWRVPRTLAVALLLIFLIVIMTFMGIWLVPAVYHQLVTLLGRIPSALDTVTGIWLPNIEQQIVKLNLMEADEVHQMLSGSQLLSHAQSQIQTGIAGLWRTGTSLANGLVYGLLIPVITFFFLKDHQRLVDGLRALVPRDLRPPVHSVVRRVDQTLRTVLKGQATVAAILMVMYVAGLSAVGISSGIVIGVVAGVCRIVPYLDVVVGGLLSIIVVLSDFQGWTPLLFVMLVFLVVQAVDGAVVTPLVMRGRVGLHPLLVIVSVLAFAAWIGFWGVLLAIPVVAVVKEMLAAGLPYYRASKAFRAPWFNPGGAGAPSAPGGEEGAGGAGAAAPRPGPKS